MPTYIRVYVPGGTFFFHFLRKKREQPIWQRRFWEHTMRSEEDFAALYEYIHYHPVKHGHGRCPYARDWLWAFRRPKPQEPTLNIAADSVGE